jgi:putative membrane protein
MNMTVRSTISSKKLFTFTILTFFISFPLKEAFAQWGRDCGGYSMMGPGMMGGWGLGWFVIIFMLIFWVLVIVGLVSLIKWLIQTTSREKSEAGGGRVLDILKERYTRGEIDKRKYKEMRKDLS